MVRNLWPSVARFVFSCYRHWLSIVLKNGDSTANILHSREGVIPGYPLAMIVYVIGVLPLIKRLKAAHIVVTKTRHTNDSGALSTLDKVDLYFNSLNNNGLA